ncbi:hypothetical protein ACFVS2_25290 [Brevibacillus sp. NPDC058079]|uniref:hypothetical protein n=1 Tax=Brevibacillus sp. NPDC058079 TaxID=3346330 RepID=UPI0036E97D82
MKMAFYSIDELKKIFENMFNTDNDAIRCEVEYSENLKADVVILYGENDAQLAEMTISDTIPQISQYIDVPITSYDVVEVGDFGEGFAFFF